MKNILLFFVCISCISTYAMEQDTRMELDANKKELLTTPAAQLVANSQWINFVSHSQTLQNLSDEALGQIIIEDFIDANSLIIPSLQEAARRIFFNKSYYANKNNPNPFKLTEHPFKMLIGLLCQNYITEPLKTISETVYIHYPQTTPTCVEISNDDLTMAIGFKEGFIEIWNKKHRWKTEKTILCNNTKPIEKIEFTLDGKALTAQTNETTLILDIAKETYEIDNSPTPSILDNRLYCINNSLYRFSSDMKTLARTDKNIIELWNMNSRKMVKCVKSESPIAYINFSPNGTGFATITKDKFVQLWRKAPLNSIAAIFEAASCCY